MSNQESPAFRHGECQDKEAMPLAMFSEDINQLSKNFTEWWRSRSIPATRAGLRKRMERLPYLNLQEIINQSFGLSLSDQYWIRPIHMNDLKWEDINYFSSLQLLRYNKIT